MPASHIASKILGPAGTLVELSFKRQQGPAVLTVHVACIRAPPQDRAAPERDTPDSAPAAGRAFSAELAPGSPSEGENPYPKTPERRAAGGDRWSKPSPQHNPKFQYKGLTHTDWRDAAPTPGRFGEELAVQPPSLAAWRGSALPQACEPQARVPGASARSQAASDLPQHDAAARQRDAMDERHWHLV